MFFNAANNGFPFQMPFMNGQMPQFQMPNMSGQNPFQMPNMNGQNPFQMPFMNGQMPFPMPFMFPFAALQMQPEQLEQLKDQWSKMFSMFGIGEKKNNGLPFDIPTDLLQFLLHMDSTPEGLSKFQKILDFIFDEYTKACTKEDTTAETAAEAE